MPKEKEAALSRLYEAERGRLAALADTVPYEGAFLQPVFGDGETGSSAMLIGEAPGGEETAAGRPFVGKAGRQLNELLQDAGLCREELFVTNTVKYRPFITGTRSLRNRTPKKEEIAGSLPLLLSELQVLGPEYVLTLGNVPLQAVLRLAGVPVRTVGSCHGTEIPLTVQGQTFTLLPLYHPASVLYDPSLKETLRRDVCFAGNCIKKM